MIHTINTFLFPLEVLIKNNRQYIGYFFLLLAFASFGFLFYPDSTKDSGEKVILVLWTILWIPIFSRVFGLHIARELLPLRKELGILMGTLAFVHGGGFIFHYPEFILDTSFWWQNGFIGYLAFGFFALLITISLALTSSDWAIHTLGKNWKRLHRLVYLIIILAVIHIVLIQSSRNFDLTQPIVLSLYFIGKILEWKGIQLFKVQEIKYPIGQQWLCVPCGYIYDPYIGDADSGIEPGVEFSDIPDDWRCPVCGVSKADFIPYFEGQEQQTSRATVISKKFLNASTIELIIETTQTFISKIGQFVTFVWTDREGEFTRQYSMVRHDGNRFTFLIKLDEHGRGSEILRHILPNATIRIKGIFGNFLLQDSKNPKIFIATGTGIAPIFNMANSLGKGVKKSLYFSVAKKDELFYTEELRSIQNLDINIHITREQVEGYEFGRVDVDTITATPETEWYLCGNLRMVAETRERLTKRGFDKIYSEEFN